MLRACLEEDGFAVVPDALSPAAVERLREAVERVRRRESPNGDPFHRLGFVGLDDAFLELLDHPAAFPLVVLDRRLWHARGDNRSQTTRIALFYAYTYRWIRPRDELGLDTALLERLDPVRRQLLGAGTSPIGYWIPTDDDVPLRAVR